MRLATGRYNPYSKWIFLPQITQLGKSLTAVCRAAWVLLIPNVVKLTVKLSHLQGIA